MLCGRCKTEYEGLSRCPACGSADALTRHPYYAQEFARLAAGGTPRFNAAAMLGGPLHALYWGCYKRFFLLYFPYLLTVGLLVTACAVSAAPAYWQWLLTGQAAGPPQPLAAAAQVTLAFSVLWGLALAVYNGNTFNRALYKARAGKPYLRRRVLPVLALLAAGLALAAVLAGGYARLTLRALWTPGYRYYEDYGDYYDDYYGDYGDDWEDFFREYAGEYGEVTPPVPDAPFVLPDSPAPSAAPSPT